MTRSYATVVTRDPQCLRSIQSLDIVLRDTLNTRDMDNCDLTDNFVGVTCLLTCELWRVDRNPITILFLVKGITVYGPPT